MHAEVNDKSEANKDEVKGVEIVKEAVEETVEDAEKVFDNAADTVDDGAI